MIKLRPILAVILSMMNVVACAAEPPSILALGDSITQGGKTFVCYRQILVPELRKRGVAFQWIGPRKDLTSAHAGYGGRNT
jgi:hypothetical protein